jgi:hypothetical protein
MPRESVEKARSAGALAAVGARAERQSNVPFASETVSLGGGGEHVVGRDKAAKWMGAQVSKAERPTLARRPRGGQPKGCRSASSCCRPCSRRCPHLEILWTTPAHRTATHRFVIRPRERPRVPSACHRPPRSRAGHCAMRRLRPRPAQSAVAAHSATHRRHRHVAFVTHLHLRLAASATHQARCV